MGEQIKQVQALQIYDSRGNPTVECTVRLANGVVGTGLVPAGASVGRHEALELRDGDPHRLMGKSVYNALDNIEKIIAPAIRNLDVLDQKHVDQTMIDLDGTENKAKLGANAILAVSMATASAAAATKRIPLYDYLGDGVNRLLPLPQVQIFGGGAHSAWRTDVQDFLIIPLAATTYTQALEMIYNVYHTTASWLKKNGNNYGVADEGGFWPAFENHHQVLQTMVKCIEQAGYRPGDEIAIALDIAASELYDGKVYRLKLENRTLTSSELIRELVQWCKDYPIISLEDPLADIDQLGWEALYVELGDQIQLIGDDLFTTNCKRIKQGVEQSLANAVLVKPNQIGTVSETLEAIRYTQQVGWLPVISARSGETEDSFIAHLAVATNSGQIKVGSFSRSERMAKWNELLRIERCLKDRAKFVGKKIFQGVC
ncbi:MAG: phosphopyruvate hydratase [Arenicellales bacterium]|nr:phosphopyruvate hydratase [Arenicellales bacterium]